MPQLDFRYYAGRKLMTREFTCIDAFLGKRNRNYAHIQMIHRQKRDKTSNFREVIVPNNY